MNSGWLHSEVFVVGFEPCVHDCMSCNQLVQGASLIQVTGPVLVDVGVGLWMISSSVFLLKVAVVWMPCTYEPRPSPVYALHPSTRARLLTLESDYLDVFDQW